MNEFKTKASQKKLDKFIELVLTKADKKGIRIASLCNDAIAVFTFNKLWEYDVINQAVVDNWSPVNKIDNLNRDFFVLCHD